MSSVAVRYMPEYFVSDYQGWEGDWELWDGIAVSMSPSPTARHQLVGGNLFEILRGVTRKGGDCDCSVIFETDWHLSDRTVIRPDISVLCKGLPDGHIDYPPSLVVDVLSPSTAGKDRTAKRDLYAREGVQIYLLVDPDENTIESLQLNGDRYETIEASEESVEVSWKDGCSATLLYAEVFAD